MGPINMKQLVFPRIALVLSVLLVGALTLGAGPAEAESTRLPLLLILLMSELGAVLNAISLVLTGMAFVRGERNVRVVLILVASLLMLITFISYLFEYYPN